MLYEVTDMAMKKYERRDTARAKVLFTLLATLVMSGALTGCLMVGGSSRGGFFIFPGSLGLIFLIIVVSLVLRRR